MALCGVQGCAGRRGRVEHGGGGTRASRRPEPGFRRIGAPPRRAGFNWSASSWSAAYSLVRAEQRGCTKASRAEQVLHNTFGGLFECCVGWGGDRGLGRSGRHDRGLGRRERGRGAWLGDEEGERGVARGRGGGERRSSGTRREEKGKEGKGRKGRKGRKGSAGRTRGGRVRGGSVWGGRVRGGRGAGECGVDAGRESAGRESVGRVSVGGPVVARVSGMRRPLVGPRRRGAPGPDRRPPGNPTRRAE
jgi:hypothetical protein